MLRRLKIGLKQLKVIIGDNLSSHLSLRVISLCEEYNIAFTFLPPNSTHLTQPLDVAFFRPMKGWWHSILQDWKLSDGKYAATIQKDVFPQLLNKLMAKMREGGRAKANMISGGHAKANMISGFRATGICPFNPDAV